MIAAPQYAGQIRCDLPGCTPGITQWAISEGGNRGYSVVNAQTGAVLSMTLIDDTDPTRQADFAAACGSGAARVVLVTIGQGEPARTRFRCPAGSPSIGIGVREFYPFWASTPGAAVTQQLPFNWFPCSSGGWVSQSPDWGWGGYAGDNGDDPATADQSWSEYRTLDRTCPRLQLTMSVPGGGWVSGIQGEF